MTRLLALALIFLAAALQAQQAPEPTLPFLPEAQRADWVAIGRVNKGGVSSRKMCSGTLVAPDLVLTAAHCSGGNLPVVNGAVAGLIFVAGWDRGDYVDAVPVAEVLNHPLGRPADNFGIKYDVALLRLMRPVQGVAPLPVASVAETPDAYGIIGYQTTRQHVLSGRLDCPVVDEVDGLVVLRCPVRSGHSGAPLLQRGPDGQWSVSGVAVRRYGADRAIAVSLGAWTRYQIEDALLRAEAPPPEQ